MNHLNRRSRTLLLLSAATLTFAGIYALGLLLPEEAAAASYLDAGLPPSFSHPFGTDTLGRDLLARTIKGLSVSITVGIFASLISAVIAVLAGAAAAGSKTADACISWLTDLVMSVPHTILVILISFALGKGMTGLLAGIAATHWCSLARLIRAEVLQLRAQQYISISRKLGKTGGWILIHHLLPHLAPQFFTGLLLLFPHAVLHEASVSFLGFGLPPEQPAIGIILSESMRSLSAGMWWSAVLPGLTLVLVILLTDKLGEQARMLLDPFHAQE